MLQNQAVSLCELPSKAALGITEGVPQAADGTAELRTHAAGSNNDAEVEEGGEEEEEEEDEDDDEDAEEIGWEVLDGPFDRDFVDALCRQQGSTFFLYSAESSRTQHIPAG